MRTQSDIFTRCSHLSKEKQVERGGVDLQVSPLVISDNGSAGLGAVLGVERVRRALAVLELLHLIQLETTQ